MPNLKHWTIFTDNRTDSSGFIQGLLEGAVPALLASLNGLKGAVLSRSIIDHFIWEEEVHDQKIATKDSAQSLRSMSSGEQQKLVLNHLLETDPDYIILDHPFDNLDSSSQEAIRSRLSQLASKMVFILLVSRKSDYLAFIEDKAFLNSDRSLQKIDARTMNQLSDKLNVNLPKIPQVSSDTHFDESLLVAFKNVEVSFDNRPILKNIHWRISKGEFWQLKGVNGSGKTTLLSMITGENSKAYGQEVYLFGYKKGSGESIWDIKKQLGYYAPTLTYSFKGGHTVEQMLISGLKDSIGLYQTPNETQKRIASDWLLIMGMLPLKDVLFTNLTVGQQRLVMVVRAMIKQPLLLILDEPTEQLDEANASLLVHLINKFAQETSTAIIYVSHREEEGLRPQFIFELQKTEKGAIGLLKKLKL